MRGNDKFGFVVLIVIVIVVERIRFRCFVLRFLK